MQPTPSAAGDSRPLGERAGPDSRSRSVRWLGSEWSTGRRGAIVLGVALVYAALFVPLARAEGRLGAAPFSTIVVATAGALLGLRGGLLAAAAALPLHTLLLNLAGQSGWDVAIRDGTWPGSAILFLVGGAIGFLRDLAVRVDAQAREIAAQRRRLAHEVAIRTDAEAAMRASEARHRELIEQAADLIYAHEPHGTLTSVNGAAEGILGYRPAELIGTNVQDIVAPSSRERSRQALIARLEGGQSQTYEVEVVAKSGELVPMEISHRLVYADGQVVGVEGIARDVSSRRRVEAARQESEARFRAVFDGAGVGVAITSLTGQIQESNAHLQQMLGHDAERLRGRLLFDLVDPADAPALRAAFDALARDGGSRQRAEPRVHGADGVTVATALTATAVHDGAGAPRFAVVVVEDTTERVRQQSRRAALLRVARRLAASSDRDAVLGDLLGEAEVLLGADAANVFRWDEARGELVVVMSSLESAAGTGPIRAGQGAVGRAIAERAAVVVADYQRDPDALEVVRAAGVRTVAAVPLMEEGRLLGALSVAKTRSPGAFDADDVEVLELLAEAAAAALVGLERARLDGVMLAARTAEHELNNRLAPTVGYAEMLATDPALPPDLRELAMLTMRGARDAARIVQQLRLVTRLEETDWGPNADTTIDIGRSIEEDDQES